MVLPGNDFLFASSKLKVWSRLFKKCDSISKYMNMKTEISFIVYKQIKSFLILFASLFLKINGKVRHNCRKPEDINQHNRIIWKYNGNH